MNSALSSALLVALIALIALATPAIGHAQGTQTAQDTATASTPSGTPGFLAADDTTPPGPVKADSLTHIKSYAQKHQPVVIIDHKVKTVKDFNALKPTSIATYKIQEASDKDVTYYGKNAKNGIITVTLVPPPAPPTKKQ